MKSILPLNYEPFDTYLSLLVYICIEILSNLFVFRRVIILLDCNRLKKTIHAMVNLHLLKNYPFVIHFIIGVFHSGVVRRSILLIFLIALDDLLRFGSLNLLGRGL